MTDNQLPPGDELQPTREEVIAAGKASVRASVDEMVAHYRRAPRANRFATMLAAITVVVVVFVLAIYFLGL